mmetsp:Transcript_14298/g.20298  ORF Transcript_14298/g.20298 Transcript_14298/m.20298 type:complete len:122 (-) Transcript_14298:63-428(-)
MELNSQKDYMLQIYTFYNLPTNSAAEPRSQDFTRSSPHHKSQALCYQFGPGGSSQSHQQPLGYHISNPDCRLPNPTSRLLHFSSRSPFWPGIGFGFELLPPGIRESCRVPITIQQLIGIGA